jgi:ribosome-associated protein
MLDPITLHSELVFEAARSGGPGGQNVNKVATKVELRFDVVNSNVLTESEKTTLLEKLTNKITTEGILFLYHQTERSQLANREKIVVKFNKLIENAFKEPKKRKPTKPSAEAKAERLKTKQHNAELKTMRKKVDF